MRKIFLIIIALSVISGCSVYQTISNVSRLKYRIQSATDYRLQGVTIADKRSLKDFTPVELLRLTAGLAKGTLLLTFKLNIEAQNPNDGTGGYSRTDLHLVSFPWRLLINDKETVKGNITDRVFVPGKGETVIIPIEIEFDAAKSFKDKNLDDLLLIILQIGGVKGSTSNLKLMAKPVLGTPMGDIHYLDEITFVDKTFN